MQYSDPAALTTFFENWTAGRAYIRSQLTKKSLLQALYQSQGAALLKDFIVGSGGGAAMLKTLAGTVTIFDISTALPQLKTLESSGDGWTAEDLITSINHNSQHYSKFYLAEHHIYGSSRVGIRSYPSSQYYVFTDFEKGAPTDSVTLTGRRPWYSLEYNDGISALSTEPYGMTDNSRYSIQHQIGNKQYELSNHLGNVLATVSDLKHPVYYDDNGDTVLHHYTAAIPAAYDYYPFGMLMPGRFVSDTSNHCQIISRNEWFTTYEDSCYYAPKILILPWWSLHGSATAVLSGSWLSLSLPDPSSEAILTHFVSANAKNTLSLTYASVSAPILVSVVEEVEGVEVLLAQYLLSQGGQGSVSLDFVPKGTAVAVHLSYHSIATAVLLDKICVSIPVMESETYLVEVCDEEEDRYRFGYNTQEKVNEISGVGNHYTAEFWEYDTRVIKRWNTDPVTKPDRSPYEINSNNPITNNDPNGDCDNCETQAKIQASVIYTFGTKKQSNFSLNVGVGGSIRNDHLQGGLNLSFNIYNFGLGTTQGSTGQSVFQKDFIISPSFTAGKGQASPMAIYTFNSMSLSGVTNSFESSGTLASNFVFNSSGRNQRVGSVGGRFGDFSFNIYNDFFPGLGDRNDRYFTGGGRADINIGRGNTASFGTGVFTEKRNKSISNSISKYILDPINPSKGRYGTYQQTISQKQLNNGQTFFKLTTANGLRLGANFTGGANSGYSQAIIHNYLPFIKSPVFDFSLSTPSIQTSGGSLLNN